MLLVFVASTIGFWFVHQDYTGTDYTSYAVSVDQIEQWTGMDFFVNLEGKIGKDQAAAVEAQDPAGLL